MDPTQCFLEMNDAMRDGDWETARERALALRDWLDRGGFYPAGIRPAEVLTRLATVLRRSAHLDVPREDSP